MKIDVQKDSKDFYLHFNGDVSFTVNPTAVCILIKKAELERLVAFGQAELQDYEVLNAKK